MADPVPLFTKFKCSRAKYGFPCKHFREKITQQNCVEISYTQFHQNQLNMEVQLNTLMTLKQVIWSLSRYSYKTDAYPKT